MMHRTLEKLMENQEPVAQYFAAAKAKWSEILADVASVSIDELSRRLSFAQYWFEENCSGAGDRWDGQEVSIGHSVISATQTFDDLKKL